MMVLHELSKKDIYYSKPQKCWEKRFFQPEVLRAHICPEMTHLLAFPCKNFAFYFMTHFKNNLSKRFSLSKNSKITHRTLFLRAFNIFKDFSTVSIAISITFHFKTFQNFSGFVRIYKKNRVRFGSRRYEKIFSILFRKIKISHTHTPNPMPPELTLVATNLLVEFSVFTLDVLTGFTIHTLDFFFFRNSGFVGFADHVLVVFSIFAFFVEHVLTEFALPTLDFDESGLVRCLVTAEEVRQAIVESRRAVVE